LEIAGVADAFQFLPHLAAVHAAHRPGRLDRQKTAEGLAAEHVGVVTDALLVGEGHHTQRAPGPLPGLV
jgi:hypothetical protein